ncbi:prolyl aminopeptidase [Rheinheimera marina]|uniref:Proline iminopeptidase n=1 Tax=Rheinheimera marina TaxID=1774958 RepID=A0ABV9JMJ3_9GAMM
MSAKIPEPYSVQWLPTADGHQLYLEQSGAQDGIPVVYCHGGPGGGSSPFHRSLFDARRYRIILFDQRGCGQSKPLYSLTNNDTQHLVADMELIREALGIERWLVCGGSWGSTLALAYGQAHPSRCLGFILRGIFLGRDEDIEWLYGPDGGASQVFPDFYRDFYRQIENAEIPDPVTAYHQLLHSDQPRVRLDAALAWSLWESRIASLRTHPAAFAGEQEEDAALALALLENHYFMHQSFLKPNQLLQGVGAIAHLPCILVHGRYDMVCKAENAWQLAQHWPAAELVWVEDAGHSASEPGIAAALYQASVRMAQQLGD